MLKAVAMSGQPAAIQEAEALQIYIVSYCQVLEEVAVDPTNQRGGGQLGEHQHTEEEVARRGEEGSGQWCSCGGHPSGEVAAFTKGAMWSKKSKNRRLWPLWNSR